MKYGICLSAQIPIREEHAESSEMVTQMLFGETCKIVDHKDSWYFVYTDTDQYLGWCDHKMVTIITKEEYTEIENRQHPCLSSAFGILKTNKEIIYVSQGSTIPFLKNNIATINNTTFQLIEGSIENPQDLSQVAKNMIGAPYLWGGRTIMGIDCSGFIVNLFKTINKLLPRDAGEQVAYGESVAFLSESQQGDVCFFDNKEGKIIHVGLLLDKNTIIHASGQVRIDQIDHQGIYNNELKKYTHHLRIIKRLK